MTVSAIWKSRPVFISSTFRDMHAERDYLRSHIFPRLEEELRKRRHLFEPIDLRLGVESGDGHTDEERELLVLKVCLDEINRSRPFLLVLLGDRYGWTPPAERMAAAAREAGFKGDIRGRSVTALEIEYGILKESPDQARRSFFYFREPLPYNTMPPDVAAIYDDAHSTDQTVRAGHDQLVALKKRLKDDPELNPRVYNYSPAWDAAAKQVTDLEAFGEMVFQHIWKELEEETRAFASQPPPTWEQQERAVLTEFVENRVRNFTGREELLGQLRALALDHPRGGTSLIGACLIGSPGSGKSAVFAELFQRLSADGAALLLAHAAGATPRGASVDSMLRRWIQELADFRKEENPLPEKASPEDVDNAFYSLLHRAAAQRRVVVMLDALDQFEESPRSRYVMWFRPKQWPANARIIATSLPNPRAQKLMECDGVGKLELASLTVADAEQIARKVWARYHQPFEAAVLRVLTEKKVDGAAAFGNPLWLTLALEQLSLLDADDFARVEREFTGSPGERLRLLMMDIAGKMPADVQGLYGSLLDWTEKAFGAAHARAFAVAIALSRFGWRENDLLALVPRLAPLLFPGSAAAAFDDLKLASLRRGFRAHLVRRGSAGQLDCFHAQMRATVLRRCVASEELCRKFHAALADHLLGLSGTDPLRQSETMFHLVGADDRARAARYYAALPDAFVTPTPASAILASHIVSGEDGESNAHLVWVMALMQVAGLSHEEIWRLCNRFQFDLDDALTNQARLGVRTRLLEGTRTALRELVASDPGNAAWQWDLSKCQRQVGNLLEAQGLIDAALEEYRHALAIRERLLQLPQSLVSWREGLAHIHVSLGSIFLAKNGFDLAVAEYGIAKVILKGLLNTDPTNASWHSTLSMCVGQEATALERQDKYADALELRQSSIATDELIAKEFPQAKEFQQDLSIAHEKLGNLLSVMGRNREALAEQRKALEISCRLAEAEPDNNVWLEAVSYGHSKNGEILVQLRDFSSAIQELQTALNIAERLVQKDPMNANWQSHFAACYFSFGIAWDKLGAHDRAGEAFKRTRGTLLCMRSLGMHLNAFEEELLTRMEASPQTNATLPEALTSNSEFQVNTEQHCCSISRRAIENLDLSGILSVCEETVSETRHNNSCHPWRVLIFGYADDPRGLYDIPDVRRWCQSAISKAPFLPFILEATTNQWLLFCLVETICVPTTGQVTADPQAIKQIFERGITSFAAFLASAGVSKYEDIARDRMLAVLSDLGLS